MSDTLEPPTGDQVLTRLHDSVAVVTLNRPEKLNAWTPTMQDQFGDALAWAAACTDVRVVVITGAGRGFCAGADMSVLGSVVEADGAVSLTRSRPTHLAATLDKPVIAAVNGVAAGLGFVQTLYADVRFASPQARFITAFSHRGLIAEYGISWLLPRIVGQSRAADLLLSGRTVQADEAFRIGLVDHLVEDPLQAALDYAQQMATWSSPASMARIKQQLRLDATATLPEALNRAEAWMLESFSGVDLHEGVASFKERRAPQFASLEPKEI